MFRRIAFLGALTALVAGVTHAWAAEAQEWDTLTRAEAVRIVVERYAPWSERAHRIADHMPPLALFWDTDQKAWYAPAVEIAFEEEIVSGFPDGSLRPGGALTQEQAAIMLTRAEGAKRGNYMYGKSDIEILQHTAEYGVRIAEPVQIGRMISYQEFLWMFPEVEYVAPASSSRSFSSSASRMSGSSVSSGIAPAALPRTASSSSRAGLIFSRASSVAFSQQYVAPQQPASNPEPPPFRTPDEVPELQYASNQPFAIAMPTLGILDLTVTHPSDPFTDEGLVSVLSRGVGHLFSYPGAGGKIFVYGHSSNWSWDNSGYAKIFRQINRLNIGDLVYVTYEGALHVYQVMEKYSVPAGDLSQFSDNGDGEELLLYTCWPPDSISERYVVRASPVKVIPF